MALPTPNHLFKADHIGPETVDDPNLFLLSEIQTAIGVTSTTVSLATSGVVSAAASGALDSIPVSTASSKASSAAVVGSIADSKAVSDSVNISVVDSKVSSVSGNVSVADSKATSGATYAAAPSATLSTADSKAVSTATALAAYRTLYKFNVMEAPYLASGNGTVDDTTAIQAALTAAGAVGGEVYLPPPSVAYRITTTLNVPSNVTMYGDGYASFIRGSATFSTSAVMIQANGATNVTLRNFRAEGNILSLPVDIVQLKTCTYSKVQDLQVRYANHEGISLNQSTYDSIIEGCLIRDISTSIGWGIGLFWDIRRCKVLNNTVLDCGAYGIVLDDGTSGQVDNLPCYRNVVSGNVVETSTTNMWGLAVEGSKENIVKGNVFNVPLATYGIDVDVGNSTTVFSATDNIITDNFVRAVTGIRLAGNYNRVSGNVIDATDTGIVCPTSAVFTGGSIGNVIRNNTIKGLTVGSMAGIQCSASVLHDTTIADNDIPSSGAYGIEIQAGDGFVITGNRIKSTQKDGIYAHGTIAGLEIRNNRMMNASLASVDGYAAIRLDATAAGISDARVTDNVYRDDTARAIGVVELIGGAATFTTTEIARNRSLNASVRQFVMLNPTTVYNEGFLTTLTGGAVTPVSVQDGETILVSATSNVTVNSPSYAIELATFTLLVLQDAVGGRTVTFDAGFQKSWSDTGNTANKQSSVTFKRRAGLWWQVGGQSPYV